MGIEIDILNWIQTLRTPFGDVIMPSITKLGNAGIIWIVLAVVLLAFKKTRKNGVVVGLALCVDFILCNLFLKNLMQRIRPCDVNTAIELLVARPSDFSFPSGHTATALAAVTALFLTGQKKIGIPALILAVCIAFSRMYLYVHYPTDILGGIVIGVLSGYVGYMIAYRIAKKQRNAI